MNPQSDVESSFKIWFWANAITSGWHGRARSEEFSGNWPAFVEGVSLVHLSTYCGDYTSSNSDSTLCSSWNWRPCTDLIQFERWKSTCVAVWDIRLHSMSPIFTHFPSVSQTPWQVLPQTHCRCRLAKTWHPQGFNLKATGWIWTANLFKEGIVFRCKTKKFERCFVQLWKLELSRRWRSWEQRTCSPTANHPCIQGAV